MKIAIGSDHAGFSFKEKVKKLLEESEHEVYDMGTENEESCDYPDYALSVGNAVSHGKTDRGLLICGTGIGMSIVANKIKGIRAALCCDEQTARMSREHNDANILCLGARTTSWEKIQKMVNIWLQTPFKQGRHSDRLQKIQNLESE